MKIVCIIGMGRSGTSLLAQILMRLGVYFGEPDELVGVTPQNVRGQFEHKRISNVLESCLRANGIDWWLTEKTILSGWYTSSGAEEARRTIADQVAGLRLATSTRPDKIVGFKDSRATLLLPLIESALHRDVVYLRCLRSPHAVTASVAKAAIPGTAPTRRECYGIWANYYMAARAVSCLDVWYDDWFKSPAQQLERVAKHIGIERVPEFEALAAIDPELCHHE